MLQAPADDDQQGDLAVLLRDLLDDRVLQAPTLSGMPDEGALMLAPSASFVGQRAIYIQEYHRAAHASSRSPILGLCRLHALPHTGQAARGSLTHKHDAHVMPSCTRIRGV